MDAPTDDEVRALLQTLIARLMKMLTRRGVLVEEMGQTYLAEPGADGFDQANSNHIFHNLLYSAPWGQLPMSPSLIDCSGGPQAGYGLTNTGDFQNLTSRQYWSDQDYVADWTSSGYALVFWTDNGRVDYQAKVHSGLAMAVHPGDVLPAIPEPQTYALMLMGLAALGLRRRLG